MVGRNNAEEAVRSYQPLLKQGFEGASGKLSQTCW